MADDLSQFIKRNVEHSIFDYHAMARGLVSTRESHFYDNISGKPGESSLHKVLGASFAKLIDGKRIPDIKQYKNPTLQAPSITAQKFFGQSPMPKVAMDQMIAKKVGAFANEVGGAGAGGFSLSGGGGGDLFKGLQSVQDIIGKSLFGSSASKLVDGHSMFSKLSSMSSQMQGYIGADELTMIDLTKPDELVKVMGGLSRTLAGGLEVFDSSVFSDGADYAKDVQSHIKKHY